MDFIDILKNKQREKLMSTAQFATYLGKHRSWLHNLYNKNGVRRPLRETTMQTLHTLLDIPYETMEIYNKKILMSRGNK